VVGRTRAACTQATVVPFPCTRRYHLAWRSGIDRCTLSWHRPRLGAVGVLWVGRANSTDRRPASGVVRRSVGGFIHLQVLLPSLPTPPHSSTWSNFDPRWPVISSDFLCLPPVSLSRCLALLLFRLVAPITAHIRGTDLALAVGALCVGWPLVHLSKKRWHPVASSSIRTNLRPTLDHSAAHPSKCPQSTSNSPLLQHSNLLPRHNLQPIFNNRAQGY